MTQNQQIKAHLLGGKSITPIDALNRFGVFRLSGRIFDLKSQGLKIKTEYVTKGKKTFAKYSLA